MPVRRLRAGSTHPLVYRIRAVTRTCFSRDGLHRRERQRTGAERVVGTLELLARRKVLALGGDALEVVGVILEAAMNLRVSGGNNMP